MSTQPVPKAFHKRATVVPVGSADLPTRLGQFRISGYRSLIGDDEFVVLRLGDLRPDHEILVRIHSQCLTSETFGSLRCDCAAQLAGAMEMIAREGRGVIVYQFEEGRGIGILNKIRAYALQDEGADTVDANQKLGFAPDLRSFRQCAELLRDLNLQRIRIISNNPEKIRALRDAGFEIVERVNPPIAHSPEALRYLRTKQEKLGHLMEALPSSDPGETVAQLIRNRRSIVSFSARPIAATVLRSLLDSARWAASSFNEQPWRFVVALRAEHADEFERMLSCLSERNCLWAKNAPVLILTTAKRDYDRDGTPNPHAFHDVGLAIANLSLHGAALGLQIHQMGGFDARAAQSAFAIPKEHMPVTISAIGYPNSLVEAVDRQRKPLDSLVYWGSWPGTSPS